MTVCTFDERGYLNDGWLGVFGVEHTENPHRFSFEVVPELNGPTGPEIVVFPSYRVYRQGEGTVRYIGSVSSGWENAYIRAEHLGYDHLVQLKADQFPGRIGVNTVLNAIEAEHLIAQAGGFVFHCSYIDHAGKAILFTAPSETGKSTQAELWRQFRGAEIINGDRAAVRLTNGQLMAEGIPFAGSSQHCKNRSLPLEAIVYLEQAPQTTIRRMRGYEAFFRIWEGVSVNTWDKEDMELVSQVVQRTAEQVPVFHMPCTPDESAVIKLEDALRKQERL